MKRRIFIKNSSQAGIALSLLGIAACKHNEKKTTESTMEEVEKIMADPFFKLSLAQWSMHRMIQDGSVNPMDFAAKAKGWGFSGLEYVSQLYNAHLEKSSSILKGIETMAAELKKRSDDQGMENLIMMVDLPGEEGSLAIADKNIRNKAIENHHKWIDATAAMGCHSMRINLFGTREREEWQKFSVASLRSLCEYAQNSAINIIVENHGWLSSDAALLADVISEVNMTNCGTLPDFGNFCVKRDGEGNWGGNCVEEYDMYKGVKELMPYAKGVSAKSHNFNADGTEAEIDYKRMLQIVKDAGYTGYVGVEYEGDKLSEEQGILATKDLLLKAAQELS